jgi:hypothetical protein
MEAFKSIFAYEISESTILSSDSTVTFLQQEHNVVSWITRNRLCGNPQDGIGEFIHLSIYCGERSILDSGKM